MPTITIVVPVVVTYQVPQLFGAPITQSTTVNATITFDATAQAAFAALLKAS